MARKDVRTFEGALAELEGIVQKLERGEVNLDEGLKLFEKGVGALRRCYELLETAEKKVQTLAKGLDGFELKDWSPPGEEGEA